VTNGPLRRRSICAGQEFLHLAPCSPTLASTLRRIVEEAESRSADRDEQIEAARDVFYRGVVADAIVQYVTSTRVMDTSGRRHGGLLSGDDLAAYRAELEGPATLGNDRRTEVFLLRRRTRSRRAKPERLCRA
jgi:gamma-glutamyltranspeptidase